MGEKKDGQLIIREPGKPECAVPLTGTSTIIGRSRHTSDLEIAHDSISRQHICISREQAQYFVEDLGSANGTKVNGQPLPSGQKHTLRPGDIIRIGQVTLILQGAAQGSDHPKQATIHLNRLQELMHLASFTIGRDRSNELPLPHPRVSRRHAEVKKTEQGYVIRDLHSTNGTFVNGQPVRGKHLLRAGDNIRIGPFRIVYNESGFSQARSLVGYRLDALGLIRQVGGNGAKKILKDVNLSIYPREFVALVGGSGAGKSTLMKALNGFVRADDGHVLINGDDFYENIANYRNIIGYVPQDDIVHRQLSARSALMYAAQIRLPDHTEPEFIKQRVEEALAQVELTSHADTPIQQLSGGQRKRVSIAVELLSDPKLFFLDEPTSGLDPGLEKKMMEMLRKRAEDEDGRIIVLVTHATLNINQCSHVAFMADGNLVYFGPPQEASEFFGEPDFADIYNRVSSPSDAATWAQQFRQSDSYQTYVTQRLEECQPELHPAHAAHQAIPRNASSFRQFMVLAQRYFELIFRDVTSLITLFAVMPLIGMLILIMADRYDLVGKTHDVFGKEIQETIAEQRAAQNPAVGDEQFSGTYNVVGPAQKLLFMFALAANLLGIFAAAYEIIKEEAIYQRERMVNLKIPPYLFSKIMVLSIFALIQCLLFMVVVGIKLKYPTAGIRLPALLEIYVTLLLATLASICLGLLISALVRSANTVIYIVLVVLFVQIIFAGAIFDLPAAAKPISYITPTRWTLEALGSIVDLEGLKAQSVSCVEFEDKDTGETKAPCLPDQLRQSLSFDFHVAYKHDTWHLLSRWLALLGFALFFGVLAAILQKRKDVIQ